MDLRLFLVSFSTGACAVLFGTVLIAIILDSRSGPDQASRVPDASRRPEQGQAWQLELTPTVVPTLSSRRAAESTSTSEPTQEQNPTTTPPPVPTSELDAPGALSPPTGLTAEYIAGQGIFLSWQAAPDAAFYNVYRSSMPGGGPEGTYVALGSSGTLAFQDFGVQPGQSYYFVVTSSASGLESSTSEEIVILVP